jgi:hypothetical protein
VRFAATTYRCGTVIRLLPIIVLLVVVVWLVQFTAAKLHTLALRRTRARIVGGDRPGAYDWNRRTDQLRRDLKGIGGPPEQRADIVGWLDSHTGVEAYVEPKTVVSPLSVVFVDGRGEWRRFELAEDRFLKELARERRIPVKDATKVGYPPRMRRHRRSGD